MCLLNCVQVIVDEPTFHALVSYIVRALSVCSKWTHTEVLLALSSVLYGNGPQCQKVDCPKQHLFLFLSTIWTAENCI